MVNSELKIAVVDDEKDLVELYARIIQRLGYSRPLTFTSGTSLVHSMAIGRQSFDVIIMDYRMPEMNGIDAAKIIKRYRKDTNIVLVTGYHSLKEDADAAGLVFLGKPFSISQLAECLEPLMPVQIIHESDFSRDK
jgi:DNA-binding NtrC family response regulator